VEPAVNESDKGWQSLLPDGLERWLKGRKDDNQAAGPGTEWRPSADAPAPGVSSPDPSLLYQPPGVEWSPAAFGKCPACGAEFSDAYTPGTSQFCEKCGAARLAPVRTDGALRSLDPDAVMAPPRPCVQCGGAVDSDAYCTVCGFKAASERDHYREEPAPWVAGVCDRGLKHSRNEDAIALAAGQAPGERAVLVVCDGVSSSVDSDVASLAAAEAARDLLWADQPQGLGVEDSHPMERALTEAAAAANEAVVRTTDPASENAASATFVVVVVSRGHLFYANLGDSRAYWLPDAGDPVLLTRDDSMAEARVEMGVPRQEAENGPGAHAITKWLGRDAPDIKPRTGQLEVGDGWVLVCSDGLWNYVSTPAEIRTVLDSALTASPSSLVDVCEHLTAWANAQGGKDNISVTLARLGELPLAAVVTPSSATEPDATVAVAAPLDPAEEPVPASTPEERQSSSGAPTDGAIPAASE
jgi:serine/threonine protein phosphatase PrpC